MVAGFGVICMDLHMSIRDGNGVVFECDVRGNAFANAVDACWRMYWWGRMQACRSVYSSRECFLEFLHWVEGVLDDAGIEMKVKELNGEREVG